MNKRKILISLAIAGGALLAMQLISWQVPTPKHPHETTTLLGFVVQGFGSFFFGPLTGAMIIVGAVIGAVGTKFMNAISTKSKAMREKHYVSGEVSLSEETIEKLAGRLRV
jgi:hypothetical protein